jgi:hypothetical protein
MSRILPPNVRENDDGSFTTTCCGNPNGCPTVRFHGDGLVTVTDDGKKITIREDELEALGALAKSRRRS